MNNLRSSVPAATGGSIERDHDQVAPLPELAERHVLAALTRFGADHLIAVRSRTDQDPVLR
ncbi:hypothetical protein GCM10022225_44910 [Plantactinospora mayteni]|uniref:Uncharacterized protein n=1 Tax=Plantactinospora mayteni TaxID=566021 RepID=A0ABQ4EXS8_9ACTN|nr:hypothetical protein Pma05_60040 [Plantactinospora mayteni]